MARTIVKEGKKPQLLFHCKMCKTEWKDSQWQLETEPKESHMSMFMSLGFEKEFPTSRCPVCNVRANTTRN